LPFFAWNAREIVPGRTAVSKGENWLELGEVSMDGSGNPFGDEFARMRLDGSGWQ
jgi:hypothetical protein